MAARCLQNNRQELPAQERAAPEGQPVAQEARPVVLAALVAQGQAQRALVEHQVQVRPVQAAPEGLRAQEACLLVGQVSGARQAEGPVRVAPVERAEQEGRPVVQLVGLAVQLAEPVEQPAGPVVLAGDGNP